jgi:hypothetical protein
MPAVFWGLDSTGGHARVLHDAFFRASHLRDGPAPGRRAQRVAARKKYLLLL